MNGMIVTVATYVMHDPIAPRIPTCLFQNPQNRSEQISHSITPRNQLPPRMPNAGYIHEISGPLLTRESAPWPRTRTISGIQTAGIRSPSTRELTDRPDRP